MDKRGSVLGIFLLLLFVILLGVSVLLGMHGMSLMDAQRGKIAAKEAEIEKLSQQELALKKSIEEAEQQKEKLEEENNRLKREAEDTESQKKVILKQVRSSVDSFESFRVQSGEEIARLKSSMEALEKDKKALEDRIASETQMTKAEKEKLESRLAALTQEVSVQRQQESQILLSVRQKEKIPIVVETAKRHYNLGNFYFKGREYAKAAAEYEKALFYQPNDPAANHNLGVVYDEYLGDRMLAVRYYRKYLTLQPEAPDRFKVRERILDLEMGEKVMGAWSDNQKKKLEEKENVGFMTRFLGFGKQAETAKDLDTATNLPGLGIMEDKK